MKEENVCKETEDPDKLWGRLICYKSVKHNKQQRNPGWPAILELMNSAQQYKGKDRNKYKETHTPIRKIIKVKDNWMLDMYEEHNAWC